MNQLFQVNRVMGVLNPFDGDAVAAKGVVRCTYR